MRITVQLTADATRRVRGSSTDDPLFQWLGHKLEPVHPDTSDPALVPFFSVEVAAGDEAAAVLDRLLTDPAVEAAYIKPDDEPASR